VIDGLAVVDEYDADVVSVVLSIPGLADVVVVVWKEDEVPLITVDVTNELEVVESALDSEFVILSLAVGGACAVVVLVLLKLEDVGSILFT
jgi:hypothetical protein